MSDVLWACWDGGGNLPPSIGIAHELEARGHTVHFHGRPEMVDRVRAAGLAAEPLAEARTDLDRYDFLPLPTVFGYTSSPAVGEELVELVAATDPDVVVIDAMFSSALQVAPRFDRPTVVVLHTFCDQILDGWRANFTMQSESRVTAGFAPLDDLDVLWGQRDRLHVNTLAAFDGPPAQSWTNVVHGAPVLASEPHAVPVELPWAEDDPTPTVLLSFSTVPEQRNVDSLQRALDALGPLPVHVVATTGGVVDPAELTAPANAHLLPFADHDQLMARATLVLGHGGHGTTMRALRHGLPIVGMPAKGADQVPITQLLERWGVGKALPGDASVDDLRAAVEAVLADPSYAAEAAERARALAGPDGAVLAADSIDAVLTGDHRVTAITPA